MRFGEKNPLFYSSLSMKNSLPLKGAEEFTPPATKKLESTKLSTDLRVNQKSILKFFVKIKF